MPQARQRGEKQCQPSENTAHSQPCRLAGLTPTVITLRKELRKGLEVPWIPRELCNAAAPTGSAGWAQTAAVSPAECKARKETAPKHVHDRDFCYL